ncbi:hypothetical protein B7486_17245 [cyanobacterium TDX16]|nr:hypothetical protein B7486_17245 [cyanobacterium TDX16]
MAGKPEILRKRIRRLTVVALASCILLSTASALSFWRGIGYFRGALQIEMIDGGLIVGANTIDDSMFSGFAVTSRSLPNHGLLTQLHDFLSMPTLVSQRANGSTYWIAFGPFILALVLVAGLAHFFSRRRIPSGHCHQCGYDLTGNESGRCPECGASVKPGYAATD